MDPTKQAAMIMIQSMQAQLVGLMNVLGIGAVPSAYPAAHRQDPTKVEPDFLSTEEEDKVEESLESIRKEALGETALIQDRWKKLRELIDEDMGIF